MKLIIDLDGIVVNHTDKWYGMYNEEYNDNLTIDKPDEWDLSKRFVKPECGRKIYEYLGLPGFFEDLPFHKGAQEALESLRANHEIVICSATDVPEAAKGKMIWMKRYLPWVDRDHLILTHGKQHVRGDVLIDDSGDNATKFRIESPNAQILGIEYAHNINCKAYNLVAKGCLNTAQAWNQIVEHIDFYSENFWYK